MVSQSRELNQSGRRWAVVTGASSGLGVELARELARRGYDLLLVARSEERLAIVASELATAHNVQIRPLVHDLAVPGAAEQLFAQIDQAGFVPEVLVNNAGRGLYGPFLDRPLADVRAMLQLDLTTLTELTYLASARMKRNGHGKILLVASMAAYQPVPLMSAYAAAKAYVLSLGEALAVELAPLVGVTVLSPGLMDTGFNAASDYVTPDSLKRMELRPADVARIGIDALLAGRSGVIAGRLNKVMAFSSRLMSRHFSAKTSYQMEQRSARADT